MPNGSIEAGKNKWRGIPWPTGPTNSAIVKQGFFNLVTVGQGAHATGHIWFIGVDDSGGTRKPTYLHDEDFDLAKDVFIGWECPEGTAVVSVFVQDSVNPVDWALELIAK